MDKILEAFVAVFPDWASTLVILAVTGVVSSLISLYELVTSKVFGFSVWLVNVALAMAIAVIVITVIHAAGVPMSSHTELLFAMIAAITSKDILNGIENNAFQVVMSKLGIKVSKDEKG